MRPGWGHGGEVQPRERISSCLEPWQQDSGLMVSPEMVSSTVCGDLYPS